MANKPDYYTVLGVERSASADDIKRAFNKIAMSCHPDMLRNKTEAEKKTAAERFQLATEAKEVLTNPEKRRVYDQGGHEALAKLKSGQPVQNTYNDPPARARPREDVADFFNRYAKNKGSSTSPTSPSSRPVADTDRESAAEARRRSREQQTARPGTPSSPPAQERPAPAEKFTGPAQKESGNNEAISELLSERDELRGARQDLKDGIDEIDQRLKEIEAEVARLKRGGGAGDGSRFRF